jgi:peptide/nickel transport system permease protein
MKRVEAIPVLERGTLGRWLMHSIHRQPGGKWAFRFLVFLVSIAVLADFLAYPKPLWAVYKGETHFPMAKDWFVGMGWSSWQADLVHADWKTLDLESAVWAPVRWGPNELDTGNGKIGPFDEQSHPNWKFRHFLGTHTNGKDVLSGLIHGTRISLTIGIVAVGIAGLIGILLGSIAGFFGDHRLQLTRAYKFMMLFCIPLAFFYAFQARHYILRDSLQLHAGSFGLEMMVSLAVFVGVLALGRIMAFPLERIPYLARKSPVAVDLWISRLTEIVSSVPALLLLLSILVMTKRPSIYFTMTLIGLISWAGIAQLMRAEMLRVRKLDYITAAEGIGLTTWQTMLRHALPNSISSVLVVVAFGIAGAITLESGLSFLGIGVPDDTMTWGKILQAARFDIRAWWLTLFPGLFIFLTVTSINLVGEALRTSLDPKWESVYPFE